MARSRWKSRAHFAGWEIYHLKGSPADPDRLYASQSSGWFGQVLQRSDDGGKTWSTPGGGMTTSPEGMPQGESNRFVYDTSPETGKPLTTHQWYDGTQHPWEFKRVWHLEPSLDDPDTVYAGVEDAALFRSKDGGRSWHELPGLRGHESGPAWQPGAGGMGLHTIVLDPTRPGRIYIAISAAGVFRTDDGGATWKPVNKGLQSQYIPDPDAQVGHCVHRIAMHPAKPDVLYMQKHWDVMRTDDSGESWREISGNLPSDFGFPIDVHAHEPETVYVVPLKSDAERFPIDGQLRGSTEQDRRRRVGALDRGFAPEGLLRQHPAGCDVGRQARLRAASTSARPAARFMSRPTAATAGCADRPRPAAGPLGGGPDAAMIRVVIPYHLRMLANVGGELRLSVEGPVTQRAILDALEARYPMLRGTIRDHATRDRRPFLRFFACEQDLSLEPPDSPLPDRVARGEEPFLVVGAIAGG
ncbi:MAG: hypothetical protein U0800_20990 [Isosphaeraceae bacterium]